MARPYGEDRTLDAMILVDRLTHQTVGMAMVEAVGSNSIWRPSRRFALHAIAGTVIASVTAALSGDFALAAAVGVAAMLLLPTIDRIGEETQP